MRRECYVSIETGQNHSGAKGKSWKDAYTDIKAGKNKGVSLFTRRQSCT